MQEKVITPQVEPGLDFYLETTDTDKAHHIACTDSHLLGVISVQDAHDRRLPNPVVRRFDTKGKYEQVLIFPTQLSYRLVGNREQCSHILPTECSCIGQSDVVVCQVNPHLSAQKYLLFVNQVY